MVYICKTQIPTKFMAGGSEINIVTVLVETTTTAMDYNYY